MEKVLTLLCKYTKCSKTASFTCTRCKEARYCSQECQSLHWQRHKKYCDASAYTRQKHNMSDSKPINRHVIIPELEYIELSSNLRKGEPVCLTDKNEEVEYLCIRSDGQMYEINSGNLVLPFSAVSKEISPADIANHWAKLMLECGRVIAHEHGVAAFYNGKTGVCYAID